MRLLHTGDWQLGLRLNFVGGESAARLRAQRFETVRRIGELARTHAVDVVVVAGDVFDDNGVGADTLQQARDALAAFAEMPVVLLPGNHDPATPDSALARLGPLPGRIHLALDAQPLRFTGFEVWPCPLTARHAWEDPAADLPPAPRDGLPRVVVAHGGALDFGESTELPNRIDVPGILARGYDYVALGDWHGLYRVDDRAWYAGAPEATRFKEKRPGYVLLVEVDAQGAAPRVTELPVARTRWRTARFDFAEDDQVEDLAAWLGSLEEMSATLVEISLAGQLSLAGRDHLDTLLAEYAGRLALLRIDADTVTTAPTAADLERLRGEGFVGRAIEVLRENADPADTDALRLLYRLLQEPA
jgi:DNA repair exonuclease SbcCD nuclease subunit